MSYLKIANCRGSKPVINDVKCAYLLLQNVSIEFNPCKAKEDLNAALDHLWQIIDGSGYEISKSNLLIKKKD